MDFRSQVYRYVRFQAELLDQIMRHAVFEAITPDDKRHFARVA